MSSPFAPDPVVRVAVLHDALSAALSDLAALRQRSEQDGFEHQLAGARLAGKTHDLEAALARAKDSERRLRLALLANGEGIWEWQVPQDQLTVSGLVVAGHALTMRTHTLADAMKGLHGPDRPAVAAALHRHGRGQSAHIDIDFRMPFGATLRWLRIRGRALERDEDGHALYVTGTVRDVSDHHEAEHLRQLMAHAFASTLDALVVVDVGWLIVQANAAFAVMMDRPVDTFEGLNLRDVVQLDSALVDGGLRALDSWRGEALLSGTDGGTDGGRELESAVTRIQARDDQPQQYLVALRDISERRRAERALERLALCDTLTGLANRAAINRHLAERISRPSSLGFMLMFVDLDGFKAVNDSFGHRAGDELLSQAAARLRRALPQAFVGRWGGDEFVVMLPDGSDDYALREGAQLVIATLGQPFLCNGHRLSVTPSIGAVNYPQDGRDAATLLRRADAAMYAAKAQGRNCLVIYQPAQDEGLQRRSRMQSLLREDAERNAFEFIVQPKVDASGRMTGAELLMRWTPAEFGPVSPTEFIPIAEQIGAIPLMGRHALHAAAKVASEVRALGSDATVAVNISPRQLLRHDLERTILHACEQHQVAPAQIELEITESALVTDIQQAEKVLLRLRRRGFRLSLDDFGTGYSSLSYLRNLPFHKVKIDRSFVIDLEASHTSRRMLDGVVRLCTSLGLGTVVEGVETEAQFELLRAMGLTEFQGYYFARPQATGLWLDGLRRQLGQSA